MLVVERSVNACAMLGENVPEGTRSHAERRP
jgi:hypothetical protein